MFTRRRETRKAQSRFDLTDSEAEAWADRAAEVETDYIEAWAHMGLAPTDTMELDAFRTLVAEIAAEDVIRSRGPQALSESPLKRDSVADVAVLFELLFISTFDLLGNTLSHDNHVDLETLEFRLTQGLPLFTPNALDILERVTPHLSHDSQEIVNKFVGEERRRRVASDDLG